MRGGGREPASVRERVSVGERRELGAPWRLVIKAQSKGEAGRPGLAGKRGQAGQKDGERWGQAGRGVPGRNVGGESGGCQVWWGLGGGGAPGQHPATAAENHLSLRLPRPVPTCLSRPLRRASFTMDCSCVSDLLFAPPALPALWTPGNWPRPRLPPASGLPRGPLLSDLSLSSLYLPGLCQSPLNEKLG